MKVDSACTAQAELKISVNFAENHAEGSRGYIVMSCIWVKF